MILKDLSANKVLDPIRSLEDWIEPKSHPRMDIDIDFDDVGWIHVDKGFEASGGESEPPEIESAGVNVSLSERFVEFAYWDVSAEGWRDVSLTSAEAMKDTLPQDIQNVNNPAIRSTISSPSNILVKLTMSRMGLQYLSETRRSTLVNTFSTGLMNSVSVYKNGGEKRLRC